MALSRAGWANEMDGFGAINELQLGERHDAVLVERGLEREIEAGEVLIAESRAIVRAILTRRFSRAANLFAEQKVDGFKRRRIAALDAAQRQVQNLEHAGHLQADQVAFNAVDHRGRGEGRLGSVG